MSKFEVKAKIAYPVEVVFEHFMELAKDSFNKFDVKNPVGAKSKRVYKKVKTGDIYIESKVTGFAENEFYSTETVLLSSVYKSRYEFKEVQDYVTEITLLEEQDLYGVMNKVGFMLQRFGAKKKIQRKLDGTAKALEEYIDKEIAKKAKIYNKALEEVNEIEEVSVTVEATEE